MKNIKQLFRRNPGLLDKPEVKELIIYIQELEGEIFEKKIEDNYDKEHMLKSMLSDILTSCREYEENKLLQDKNEILRPLREIRDYAVGQNLTTLRNRVNELGVSEPIVQRQGSNRIVVQLPGVQDPTAAKKIIGKTANLEFRPCS